MLVIVMTSQKGGSGKSTLAAHLAVEAERAGDGPVYLIDTDKQGSLTTWHEARQAETPKRIEVPFAQLSTALARLADAGASYVMIDTPPTISDNTAQVLQLADLVVIPVKPSPQDLWAVGETVDLVKKLDRPFLFVVTQAVGNAKLTFQTSAVLSKHGVVAETMMQNRVPYAAAMLDGRTAPELGARSAAAEEVASLWSNVKTTLHASMQTTKQERRKHG